MSTEYGSGGGLEVQMDGPFATSGGGSGGAKMTTISAPAANWKGGESPYSMSVGVDGVSVSSKVDVQLSAEQMALLENKIITFMAENYGGIVTLYAFGDKPDSDIDLQAVLTEVNGEGVILGSMAATSVPRSNYSQTDPTKADFILNKPDAAITKAQSTADAAAKTAGAALPKAGGTMTGAINMGSRKITNLASPEEDTDAASRGFVASYVDGKHLSAQVTLTAAGWSAAAPYTQTVAVSGILATDRPHYGAVYSGDTATALAQKEGFAVVDDLDTAAGSVTFTCFEEKPVVDLTIQLEVNR